MEPIAGRCPRPRVLHGSGTTQTSENCKFLHVSGSRGFMETMKDLRHSCFTNEVAKVQKEPKRGFTGGHSRGVEMGERGSNHGGGTQHWKPLHPIRGTRKSDALRRRTIGSDTRGLPRSRRQTLRKASFTDTRKKPKFPPKRNDTGDHWAGGPSTSATRVTLHMPRRERQACHVSQSSSEPILSGFTYFNFFFHFFF